MNRPRLRPRARRRPSRRGLTLSELVVVLLVLAILSLIAVLLFGRVRENAAEEVCRTNAAAMARNAEAIAGDAQAVTGAHLATAYAESSFPAGSSWDAGLLRLVHATAEGDCTVQFTVTDGEVEVGEPVLDTVFSDPSADGPTPAAPVSVIAVPGDRSVSITWGTPPEDVTGHQVETCVVGGSCTVSSGGIGSVVVADLDNGVSYRFRVAASNPTGIGEYSESTEVVVPRTVPDAPAPPVVDADGTSVDVTVTPGPENGAPIIEYVVRCISPDGGATVTVTEAASVTPIVVSGLTAPADATANITYTCTVRSRNAAGDSEESDPSESFTTYGVPAAPVGLTVVSEGDGEVTLSWSAPSFDGGSPVTGYLVEQDEGLFWTAVANLDDAVLQTTVTGLTNGTSYDFRVTAENALGWGAVSAAVTATPFTSPDPVTSLTASAGNTQLTLTWSAPAAENGRPVTDYVVEYSATGAAPWTVFADGVSAETGAVVTGLANGTLYTVRVAAVNLAGSSSPASTMGRPVTVATAPSTLAAAPGTGASYATVTVTWAAPASNGGSAVTSYAAEVSTSADFSSPTAYAGVTSPWALSSLNDNTTYYVRVRALNAAGQGAWGSTSALTVPAAPSVSITCPQGYNASGVLVNALTSSCTVTTSTATGATIDGLVAGPGGYSTTYSTASYSAPGVPLANLYDSQMMANARLCNASGCGPYAAYLGVSASSVPQPATPIVTKGDCAFGYCFVYFSATHAWTYEVNLWGGPSTGVLRCYNVACSDAGGAWPVGFDGTNYYSERTNTTDGTRTLHVTDSCGGLGGCARTMLIPQGTWIRVSGTNGFASGAPSGWPNSGWCVPNGGEPLSASCNWSAGPGVAEYRGGYVYIG